MPSGNYWKKLRYLLLIEVHLIFFTCRVINMGVNTLRRSIFISKLFFLHPLNIYFTNFCFSCRVSLEYGPFSFLCSNFTFSLHLKVLKNRVNNMLVSRRIRYRFSTKNSLFQMAQKSNVDTRL